MSFSLAEQQFRQAKSMTIAKSMEGKMDTPQAQYDYVLLAGIGYLASGFEVMASRLAELDSELASMKTLLERAARK